MYAGNISGKKFILEKYLKIPEKIKCSRMILSFHLFSLLTSDFWLIFADYIIFNTLSLDKINAQKIQK